MGGETDRQTDAVNIGSNSLLLMHSTQPNNGQVTLFVKDLPTSRGLCEEMQKIAHQHVSHVCSHFVSPVSCSELDKWVDSQLPN